MKKSIIIFLLSALLGGAVNAQLNVVPNTNTVQLVNNFILFGVSASNVQHTGAANSLGTFSNGSTTNLGMNDGIILTTGVVNGTPAIGSPVSNFSSYVNSTPGDSLVNTLVPGYTTYDACILEFDLIPVGNVLEFQYVFASEEYPEFVNTSFNDVFGFFISGTNPAGGNYVNQNIAIVPNTSLPVAIDNINSGANSSYYVDNQTQYGQTIVFDGFTTVLTAQCFVTPLSTYHLKMGIADAGDCAYDSDVFLKAQSMKSYIIVGNEEISSGTSAVYPNPVNSNSAASINITKAGNVIITISDRTGRVIGRNNAEYSQPGSYKIAVGQMLNDYPSGIYFMNVQTPDGNSIVKIVK